jgi:alkanesulfonate monooxygenase SsuD/methylene tetrahydromethanopterin reductase-like flavin-dependent oxidoreductase (luciferase family)
MIRVGVALIPEVDPASDHRWAVVERLGFAQAWCLDHLAWRSLAHEPWHATVPTLAVAAMTTTEVALGTLVATPNFRHPVPFSREVMTLDALSGGRMRIGVGAGTVGFDAGVLGSARLSQRQRADRYDEFVTLLDLMLRQRRTTWAGTWYAAVDAPTVPGPVQRPRPPLVVAANGPRGMRLALTTGDGWVTLGSAPDAQHPEDWWEGVQRTVARFDEFVSATRTGTPTGFRRYLEMTAGAGPASSPAKLREDIARAEELGFTDVVVAWPRDGDPFRGSMSVLESLAGGLSAGGVLG